MIIHCDPKVGSKVKGHARSHDLGPLLAALGAEVEPVSLEFGDFACLGHGPDGPVHIGIELKTISDLVTSMRSGRLTGHQIPGLVVAYQRTYLIVQGVSRIGRRSGALEIPRGKRWGPVQAGPRPVFWADVRKFLTGLEEAGVRVRETRSEFETAMTILTIAQFWDKDYDEHRSFQVLYRPVPLRLTAEDEATRRLRSIAACLPGIGWGRSKAIVEHFKGLEAMLAADPPAWAAIDGIGLTLATAIHRAIHEHTPTRSTGRVSAGGRAPARSPRDSIRRQDTRVDPGRRPRRSVRATRAGRRKPR